MRILVRGGIWLAIKVLNGGQIGSDVVSSRLHQKAEMSTSPLYRAIGRKAYLHCSAVEQKGLFCLTMNVPETAVRGAACGSLHVI